MVNLSLKAVFGMTLLGAVAPGLCQSPPLQIEANRVTAQPKIDGLLDEEIWQAATPITDFRQREPNEGAPASQRTEVRVCFDDRHLYIAFRCFDTETELIRRTVLQRDAKLDSDDYVFVLLDPFQRERDGFAFLVNANGAKLDGKLSLENHSPDTNWDAIWDTAAQVDDEGWSAEMSIPFRSLNFDPQQLLWAINFGRFLPRNQEEVRWSAASRNRGLFRLQDAGRMIGLEGLEEGLGLDLNPYISTRWDDASGEFEFDSGLDAFYQITPNMTATLTINTDFAETEVDSRRVNLTRFPLFFPEKRDFFVEGDEFFEFQTKGSLFQPFHSRTIGLSRGGEKVDIIGGAKLTGRTGKLGVGLLGARLDQLGDLKQDDAFVGRFTYDISDESHIGLMATHGDPRANLDNSLIGADLNLKNSHFSGDNVLSSRIWGVATDDGGTRGEAFGGQIRAINDPFAFLLEGEQVDDVFRPAMGFLSRTGSRGRSFMRYRFRPESDKVLWWSIAANEQIFVTNDGDVETLVIEPGQTSIRLHSGGGFFFAPTLNREVLFEDFQIRPDVTVPAGDYRFQSARFNFSTTDAKPLSWHFDGKFGEFFDGERLQLNPRFTWRPSPNLQIGAGLSYNDVALPGGDFETVVAHTGIRFTPNPRLSWNTLAQWDNVSDQIGINSRLRWIVKPGHDVFLVVNQGYDLIDGNLRSTQTETIAKIGMTIRF